MHVREVSPVLNRVVGRHYAWCNCQDPNNIIFNFQCRADVHHHAGEGDLVEVVVQDLAQWTAVVCPPRLLAVDAVDSLVPEVRPPSKQEDPFRQKRTEAWVHVEDRDEACQREDQTHQG